MKFTIRAPSRRWLPAMILCAWVTAQSITYASDALLAEYPIPNAELAALVVDIEYPQQVRMDAMSRVMTQAVNAGTNPATWFESIAKDKDAPVVIRNHALQLISTMDMATPELIEWLFQELSAEESEVVEEDDPPDAPVDEDGGEDVDLEMLPEAADNSEWLMACVAHLAPMYFFYSDDEPEKRIDLLLCLKSVAEREADGVRAAAMMAIGSLAKYDPVADEMTSGFIRDSLQSGTASAEEYISTLQMAVQLGLQSVLPTAADLAADNSQEFRLRMCAIGAIGELGDMHSIESLRSIAASNPILRKVANNAILNIQQRSQEVN